MQNIPQQMKAIAVDEFGGLDKLTLHTLPVPTVDAGEILIRIEIAGCNVWDAMEREGVVSNEVHFPRVLGSECAGTIAAVGNGVERFAIGDRVYAQSYMNDKGGSYAQYVVVSEQTVAPMPDGLDMLMAGGLPCAGATALSNLEALEMGKKTKLMLWGASGSVGHAALQLAKRMGADVFAIASGADGVELSEQLGADAAVDGHSDDVMERARAFAPDGFDTALVLLGGDKVQSTLSLVRQGGIVAFPDGVMPEPTAPNGVELKKADGFANPMLLDRLNRLVSSGEFQVHIAQTFALEEAAQAQDAMKHHYLGKIVLRVSGESNRGDRMSEQNKAILAKGNAAIAKGNNEGLLSFCADDTEWTFVGDKTLKGKEAVRQYMAATYIEPPKFTVTNLIAEGDLVTALGDITLKDADGQAVHHSYCDVWRFHGGKIVELTAFVIKTEVE